MELTCKLVEKSFHNNDTNSDIKYHVLVFTLCDGSTLEIPVKSDKARLLSLSANTEKKDYDWPA